MSPDNIEFWFGGIILAIIVCIWGFYFGAFEENGITLQMPIFDFGSTTKFAMIIGTMVFLFWISYMWIQYQRNYLHMKDILETTLVKAESKKEQGTTLPKLRDDM